MCMCACMSLCLCMTDSDTYTESQSKVRMLKDNLQVCKAQLRCKRDELKRLWLDEIKYKQMLKIVDQV